MLRTAGRNGGRWPLLRLWAAGDWPIGAAPAGGIAVEWAGGQPGHPTSYALLGGFPSDDGVVVAVEGGERFHDSLAGAADAVEFGLPDPFANEVRMVLADQVSGGFTVNVAAHATSGSSVMAFRFVASFLAELLEQPDVAGLTDAQMWELWAAAQRRRGS